jgi:tetratricopeptide (TPR) repeat protein
VVITATAPGFAQSAKQVANRLFSEGNVLYDKGDYAGALKKFEEARSRYPSYKIDLNIATALVDLGRVTEAAETYERFLQRGSALAPDEILLSARAKLKNLRARLGRLSVTCSVEGATLKVDDKPIGLTPRQLPVYLHPGDHRFEACKQGYTCSTEAVTVTAGEQRELTLTLSEAPATAAPPAESAEAPTGQAGSGWKATTGWVTLGVGGASLITGVIFGAMVSSKSDEHAEAIADGKTYGELQEIADAGRRYETVQIATLIIGGVALAAGGGLLLWHYLGRGGESRSSAFVAPMLSAEVRGLVGGLRF